MRSKLGAGDLSEVGMGGDFPNERKFAELAAIRSLARSDFLKYADSLPVHSSAIPAGNMRCWDGPRRVVHDYYWIIPSFILKYNGFSDCRAQNCIKANKKIEQRL